MNNFSSQLYYFGDLAESEQKVLRFIEKDPAVVIQYTIQQVAMMAGTSVSAVQRFTKAIGFSGYRDFRSAVIRWKDADENEEPADSQDLVRTMASAFSYSIQHLQDIDESLVKELSSDICSDDKINQLGRYRNKTVVDKLAMNLMDLGLVCICACDEISFEHVLYVTDPKSCVIIFSSIGEPGNTVPFFQQLKNASDKRWLITNNMNPKMGKFASRQITLPGVHVQNTHPVSAQFIMMAFIEILTACVAQQQRRQQ